MLWATSEQILIYERIENNPIISSAYGRLSLEYETEEKNFSVNVKSNSTVE